MYLDRLWLCRLFFCNWLNRYLRLVVRILINCVPFCFKDFSIQTGINIFFSSHGKKVNNSRQRLVSELHWVYQLPTKKKKSCMTTWQLGVYLLWIQICCRLVEECLKNIRVQTRSRCCRWWNLFKNKYGYNNCFFINFSCWLFFFLRLATFWSWRSECISERGWNKSALWQLY